MEGYLFDPPAAQAAFRKAARIAHGAGRRVALSLSDPFCVGRHRDAFRALVREDIDILFANEAELLSLYETTDLEQALAAMQAEVMLGAVTRSELGSVVVASESRVAVPAVPTRWWIPPARAMPMRRASWRPWRSARIWPNAGAGAAWRRPR